MFLQHSFQFLMYCILRGRQHPQIDDACAEIVGKDKSAKVPVACNENARWSWATLSKSASLASASPMLATVTTSCPASRSQRTVVAQTP
jgi:hypothetical protein